MGLRVGRDKSAERAAVTFAAGQLLMIKSPMYFANVVARRGELVMCLFSMHGKSVFKLSCLTTAGRVESAQFFHEESALQCMSSLT